MIDGRHKNDVMPGYEWDEWWGCQVHNIFFLKNQNHLYGATYF